MKRRLPFGDLRIVFTGMIIFMIIIVAIFGPLFPVRDPFALNPGQRLQGPSRTFILGTDEYGRDLLARIVFGTRASIVIAISSVTIATVGGVLLGTVGGFWGGITEILMMRFVDILLSFPPIVLAIVIVGLLGTSIINLIIVIGILYIPIFARISYGSLKSLKEEVFVEAAKATGASSIRILVKEIIPNIMSPIIVQFSLSMAAAILLESGLSFLGLGVRPPTPSWGYMIGQARGYMQIDPWYIVWPSLFLSITIWAINIFGDALRDILDPRMRYKKRY